MKAFADFPPDARWGQRRGMIQSRKSPRLPNGDRACRWCGASLGKRGYRRGCELPRTAGEMSCEAKLRITTSWIFLRQLILERDGGCVLCGKEWAAFEVDHIVRVIDGGTDAPENLRTLCHRCHVARHAEDLR